MKTIKVKVKQKHITKGRKRQPEACPIYHAMKDMGFKGHAVMGDVVEFDNDGSRLVAIPAKAEDFVDNFDYGRPVSPFEFNIRVPNELVPFPLLLPE